MLTVDPEPKPLAGCAFVDCGNPKCRVCELARIPSNMRPPRETGKRV